MKSNLTQALVTTTAILFGILTYELTQHLGSDSYHPLTESQIRKIHIYTPEQVSQLEKTDRIGPYTVPDGTKEADRIRSQYIRIKDPSEESTLYFIEVGTNRSLTRLTWLSLLFAALSITLAIRLKIQQKKMSNHSIADSTGSE
jgi:hypothetical protein